jgi:chemotaxis protein CheY-P-specific phosphatase CheC
MQLDGSHPELSEMADAGVSGAAEALSLLLYRHVSSRTPTIYNLTSPEALLLRLRFPRLLISITQTVYAQSHGRISIALSREGALELIDLLVDRRGSPTRVLGSFELDALKETANIVNGSLLSPLGRRLGLTAHPTVPSIVEGEIERLVQSFVPGPECLCIESRLLAESGLEILVLLAVTPEPSKSAAKPGSLFHC